MAKTKNVVGAEDEAPKAKNNKVFENLSPVEMLVIAKLLSETQADTARAQVKQGETFPLDFTVSVKGLMSIGKDNLCPCHFRLPVMQIIHKMAEKLNGITVDSVLREVLEDIKAKRVIDLEPLQRAIKATEELMAASTEMRRGKVNLDVVVKKIVNED